MSRRALLTVVYKRHSLLEEHKRRPAFQRGFIGNQKTGAALVVVFEKAQLDVIVGKCVFLTVHGVGVLLKAAAAVNVISESAVAIVFIGDVKGAVYFGI